MNCKIQCLKSKIKIILSLFDLQPISKSRRNTTSYVHRKFNGIYFPLAFRINYDIKPSFMLYKRILCRTISQKIFYQHRNKLDSEAIEIDYWSESFIGKSYLDCSPSSLTIDDCKFGYLNETEKGFTYKVTCTEDDKATTLSRKRNYYLKKTCKLMFFIQIKKKFIYIFFK